MRIICKYEIPIESPIEIEMPSCATILSVQTQNYVPVMWVDCMTENKTEIRKFTIYGTGHQVYPYSKQKYIGTFQVDSGSLVFHVYEYFN